MTKREISAMLDTKKGRRKLAEKMAPAIKLAIEIKCYLVNGVLI